MTAWYRSGTVAATNGSAAVTGTSTAFLSNVKVGDLWMPDTDGRGYEITAVTDNTHITISPNYAGTSGSGKAYGIARISPNWNSVSEISVSLAEIIQAQTNILGGNGVPSDSLGTDGDVYFRQDVAEYYRKESGSWVLVTSLIGPAGPPGPSYQATSTTSITIGTGSKTFTVQADRGYSAGQWLRAANSSSNYMEGTVSSYSGTTLVISVPTGRAAGSGTFTSWNINIAGDIGPANSLAIGSVTTGTAGSSASANITGTAPSQTLNLTIPRGNTGATGDIGPQGAAGTGYKATSTTSLAIGTGSKSFTTQANLAYSAGARVRASSAANTANYMEGTCASYSGTTLQITMTAIGGSGTHADWNINLAGEIGEAGADGSVFVATSTTSIATALGEKVFTVQTGLSFAAGHRLRVVETVDADNWMSGRVVSYVGSTLTLDVDLIGSSPDTASSWNIAITGEKGNTGAAGATGPNTGLDYAWDTGTSDSDPGSGEIRVNNADWTAATFCYVSKTGRNGEALGTVIAALCGSDNAHRAHLRLFPITNRSVYLDAEIEDDITDGTTYWKIPLSGVSASVDMPSLTNVMCLSIDRTGQSAAASPINLNGVDRFEVYRDDATGQADLTATTYGISGGGIIHGRHANGTQASPTKTLSGEIISGVGGRAYYGTTGFQTSSPTAIHWVAAETQETGAFGSYLRILTTPKGSATRHERMIVADNGVVVAHGDPANFDQKLDAHTDPVGSANGTRFMALGSGSSTDANASFVAASYGTGSTPAFRGARARGTVNAPSAVQANDFIAMFGGHAHDGTSFSSGTKGLVGIKAAENWTPSAQGTYITLEVTPTGSTTRAEVGRVTSTGITTVDEAYDATNWNGSTQVPTKNAVRDKIETLFSSPTIATPTITTSATVPLAIGGTATSSTLTLQSTSGVGATDAIVFKVGNNGATEAARFNTSGQLLVGASTAYAKVTINGGSIASQVNISSGGADSGLYLTTAAAHNFYMSGGGMFNGTAWVAKNANFSCIGGDTGFFDFLSDTGLTPGNTFTPTVRARLTPAGNFKIGGSASRGTTEGTNQLVLFNGTAPAGTLTNGASIYAASGELRSMDAAGNSTLLSPHDHETNEWIYHSIDTRTGKGLRIDMERMMRAINEKFGWDFIKDFEV